MNKFLLSLAAFSVLTICCFIGCGSGNAQYQPKPEDVPDIPAGNRSGSSSDFLPDGGGEE